MTSAIDWEIERLVDVVRYGKKDVADAAAREIMRLRLKREKVLAENSGQATQGGAGGDNYGRGIPD